MNNNNIVLSGCIKNVFFSNTPGDVKEIHCLVYTLSESNII